MSRTLPTDTRGPEVRTGRFAGGPAAADPPPRGPTWHIRLAERDRTLAPYAAYRTALALLVLARGAARPGDPRD